MLNNVDYDLLSLAFNKMFSSLSMAELSASKHFNKISYSFKEIGRINLYEKYKALAEDEMGHHFLVEKICRKKYPVPQTAVDIYDAKMLTQTGYEAIIETLAIIHLAFEPKALSLMSYLYKNAFELFEHNWANEIRQSLLEILKDESDHVHYGRNFLITELLNIKKEDTQKYNSIVKNVKKHKAFLVVGTKSFFKDLKNVNKFVNDIINNYDFSFRNITQGVLL